jgi:tetratricopeptide (TPR) repeat protein
VIELSPEQVDAYILRGELYIHNGELDAAQADFDRALRLDDSKPVAYYGWGYVLLRKEDYPRALRSLNRAIELDPRGYHGRSYYYRAFVQYEMGDINGAIADLEQAINNGHDDADTHLQRGMMIYDTADYQAAHDAFSEAIQRDSRLALSYYWRARAAEELDMPCEDVLGDYERFLSLAQAADEYTQYARERIDALDCAHGTTG